jgi:hypothetical protein
LTVENQLIENTDYLLIILASIVYCFEVKNTNQKRKQVQPAQAFCNLDEKDEMLMNKVI